MPYTIAYTDEANNGTITIVDQTIDQTTTIKLPGKNVTAYGSAIAENFLHLLEHFASATEPARPTEGQVWYDTTPGAEQLKVYDGTSWVPTGGLNKGADEPDVALSQAGDLWVDTDNQQLYLNSGSGWVLVGPQFSDGLATGASPLKVIGTDNAEYTVVLIEVEAQPVAIISNDEFTPKAVIAGFTIIKPGINLSTKDISGDGAGKYYGTAEKAESLVVSGETVAAGNFLRSDTTSTSLFPLNVQNNTGIIIGTDAALNIGVEGQAGIIRHQIEGSNIDLQVKSSGTTRTVLRVDSSQKVGINTQAPDEALDVVGNIKTNSSVFINGTTDSTTSGTGALIVKGGVGIAKNLNVLGNTTLKNLITLSNTVPDGNNTRNLGTATQKWQNVHATTFVGNLTGNVNGTVSGIAGSANKLTSASTFRITGDVVADDVTFDGQTGGSLKTFNTTIGNAIISSKTETTESQIDDELILNRTSGTTGLYKITRKNLLDAVPINPVGVVLPYAGSAVPVGWLLCDGSEVRISEYSELYAVLGYTYGAAPTVTSGYFKVPDLRGRLPMGADNMGGVSANTVTATYADAIGSTGGSEEQDINVNNLPEHQHDMKGSAGNQYYALRDISGTPTDTEAIIYDSPTGSGNGQALPNSGGIDTTGSLGDPLNIMNPTLTLNYIIYTGRD